MIKTIESDPAMKDAVEIINKYFPKRKIAFQANFGPLEAIGVIDEGNKFHIFMPAMLQGFKPEAENYLRAEGFDDLEALKLNESVDISEYANE